MGMMGIISQMTEMMGTCNKTMQTTMPGEKKEPPVTIFVDPAIEDDPDWAAVATITLSHICSDMRSEALQQYAVSYGSKAAEQGNEER